MSKGISLYFINETILKLSQYSVAVPVIRLRKYVKFLGTFFDQKQLNENIGAYKIENILNTSFVVRDNVINHKTITLIYQFLLQKFISNLYVYKMYTIYTFRLFVFVRTLVIFSFFFVRFGYCCNLWPIQFSEW